jgi:hypothetical protein
VQIEKNLQSDYHPVWRWSMGKVRWKSVILGGLLAGLVINVIAYLVDGVILQSNWADALKTVGHAPAFSGGELAAFLIIGFLTGIFTIWLYAAIRPRYGAGPNAAVCAGIAVWVIGTLLPILGPMVIHMYSRHLMAYDTLAGLIEVVLGAVAGAWLCKEQG